MNKYIIVAIIHILMKNQDEILSISIYRLVICLGGNTICQCKMTGGWYANCIWNSNDITYSNIVYYEKYIYSMGSIKTTSKRYFHGVRRTRGNIRFCVSKQIMTAVMLWCTDCLCVLMFMCTGVGMYWPLLSLVFSRCTFQYE